LTEDELSSRYIQGINIVKEFGFKLYARAKHVFKEAERVYQFQDACLNLSEEAFFERAGSLMNDSMASCGELFECSCPELEQLSSICRANGAYGSRLTGAGWGGCTVSLVKSKDVTHFMQTIREQYYQKKYPEVTDLDGFLFASHAGVGAAILDIKDSS
jgi:galactokinase